MRVNDMTEDAFIDTMVLSKASHDARQFDGTMRTNGLASPDS